MTICSRRCELCGRAQLCVPRDAGLVPVSISRRGQIIANVARKVHIKHCAASWGKASPSRFGGLISQVVRVKDHDRGRGARTGSCVICRGFFLLESKIAEGTCEK